MHVCDEPPRGPFTDPSRYSDLVTQAESERDADDTFAWCSRAPPPPIPPSRSTFLLDCDVAQLSDGNDGMPITDGTGVPSAGEAVGHI